MNQHLENIKEEYLKAKSEVFDKTGGVLYKNRNGWMDDSQTEADWWIAKFLSYTASLNESMEEIVKKELRKKKHDWDEETSKVDVYCSAVRDCQALLTLNKEE